MHLPSLFVLLVYVSGYLFLLFAAVCLACGLYYLVELAEEYTTLTKKLIRLTIVAQLIVHPLLLVYERFPLPPCAVGFLAHLVYLHLLRSFPFIQPSKPPFIFACVMFILDNLAWYRFFSADTELFYQYRITPIPATASFFLLVIWLVPCAFFCSLTVNDAVLPSAATVQQDDKSKRSRNIVTLTFDSVSLTIRRLLASTQRNHDMFPSAY